ncbi:MAG: hypothetical protein AB8G23_24815 [Myxococcota bacterium]
MISAGMNIEDPEIEGAFSRWRRNSENGSLDPLSRSEEIGSSLGPLLVPHFDKHAAVITQLHMGSLNWVAIRNSFPDMSSMSLETPTGFPPVA